MDTDHHPHEGVANFEQRDRPKTEWPWYGQLCVLALLLLAIVLIFLVPSSMSGTGEPVSITGYVAMTAVLISGTFLFMTFRVDRNATNEARTIANAAVEGARRDAIDAAESAAKDTAQTAVQSRLSEIVGSILLRNLDVLGENIDRTVEGVLPRLVDGSVTRYMAEHLGDEVRAALRSEHGRAHVAAALHEAVTEQLKDAVELALPEQLDSAIPAHMDTKLPNVVAERLTEVVLRQIIKSTLDELKTEISRLVEEQLPATVEEYFATHRRVFWRKR